MEQINTFKAAFAALCAALTTLWGWMGWLVVAWIACMALDYLTGSAAAMQAGKWSSEAARNGLWHKLGGIVAVLISGILDLTLGHLLGSAPIALPFTYTVFLCPLVLVWYILTEAGSIVENAGALGAPIPEWLKKTIALFRDKVDAEAGGTDTEPDELDK